MRHNRTNEYNVQSLHGLDTTLSLDYRMVWHPSSYVLCNVSIMYFSFYTNNSDNNIALKMFHHIPVPRVSHGTSTCCFSRPFLHSSSHAFFAIIGSHNRCFCPPFMPRTNPMYIIYFIFIHGYVVVRLCVGVWLNSSATERLFLHLLFHVF